MHEKTMDEAVLMQFHITPFYRRCIKMPLDKIPIATSVYPYHQQLS